MKALATVVGTLLALALCAAMVAALGFFWGIGLELAGLLV